MGAVDAHGELAATARLVKPNSAGLPLFGHCTLFPRVTTLTEAGNTVLEVSRVSISRHYARRKDDGPLPGGAAATDGLPSIPPARERRLRRAEPFLTLLKAIVYGAKLAGATHLIGATDAPLHRWLIHYGFPYHVAGPEVDYYGLVAPHIMSLAELDDVILGRQFEALDGFPVGMDRALWPEMNEHDGQLTA